jgi:hypothetical protein
MLKNLRAAWAEISLHKEGHLKWRQWALVVLVSCMQAVAYGWCLACLVTQSYEVLAASAYSWCWFALVVGVALRGDRDLFYDEQRNLISWTRLGWNVLKLAMYSAIAFTYMVYQYCAEQNRLNKPTRYEL